MSKNEKSNVSRASNLVSRAEKHQYSLVLCNSVITVNKSGSFLKATLCVF